MRCFYRLVLFLGWFVAVPTVFGGALVHGAAPQDAGGMQDEELVKEFLRFYSPRRSTREKIEAIYVLRGANSLEATRALVKAFDDKEPQVVQAAVETIGAYRDPRSVQFLLDTFVTNKKERKENRLLAAVECLGRMGDARAADALLPLFDRAKSWEMKRALGEALGRLRDARCLPALKRLLGEKDPTLRVIAVEGMARVGKPYASTTPLDEEGLPPEPCWRAVVGALEDPAWQVRAVAIAAVRSMRFKEGIQPLIDRLREEKGRLKGDAYEALKELTFSQWDEDPDQWQRWWDRSKDTFELVDLNAVLEARRRRAREGTRYSKPAAEFAGIPTQSRRLIFVIDISGSMETQVTEIERFREGGKDYPSFERLAIVKKELIDTIMSFDDSVYFNILAFATHLKWWKKDLVRSNILNKNSAKEWVSRLKPLGGASAGFRARAGLKSTGTSEGKTNTYGALMAALGVDENVDPDAWTGKKTFKNKVDTVYFLSDGQPTVGKIVDQQEIRRMVRRVNQVRKVVIHCIAIGDFEKKFMRSLAEENGGVYVDLGK